MNEAMIRIRHELGKDAMIVSNRRIRKKGLKGFFQKKDLEVIAAMDKKSSIENVQASPKHISREFVDFHLEKEVKELRERVNWLLEGKEKKEDSWNKNNKKLIDSLKKMGLDEKLIEDFSTYVEQTGHSVEGKEILYQYFGKLLGESVPIEREMKEKIWAFIGPTGVGKTTTIAKIAAQEMLEKGKKIGLITLDTYRIGAVEQLKTYASILNIPLESVVNQSDFSQAIKKFEYCDLVLIDSTGGSSFNKKHLLETKKFLNEIDKKRITLLVSATTGNEDLKAIIQNYNYIGYDSIIVTKLDETKYYGRIFNINQYADKPLLFITTGQSVPDDIIRVSKENLLGYLFKGSF